MAKKSNAGRPTVMTDEALRLLKEAYLMDCTDEEACLNAEIGTSTLYKYQDENPEFVEKKRLWKNTPFLTARRTVVAGLTEDKDFALKYMKNKKNKEFNERVDTDVTSGGQQVGVVILPNRDGGHNTVPETTGGG